MEMSRLQKTASFPVALSLRLSLLLPPPTSLLPLPHALLPLLTRQSL